MELKIAYLKDKISRLPHGFIGVCGGKPCVCLSYDPKDPTVSRGSKRRYYCSSRRGMETEEQIREYICLKAQLDDLLAEWKITYRGEPRNISFPLTKHKPDYFDHEFFVNALPNQEKHENKHPIEFKGHILHSKNELILAQTADRMGYDFKAGIYVEFDQFTHFCPDITFYVPEADKVILTEFDGAMDKPNYISKSYHNTAACVVNGLVEMKDFVVIRAGNGYDINAEQIEKMLYAAIDSSIDDIVW